MSGYLAKAFPPFLKWPGNKKYEIEMPEIRALIPQDFENYFEPFLGGGAAYLALDFQHAYVNDICQELIDIYDYVKNRNAKFFESLNDLNTRWKSHKDKSTYTAIRNEYTKGNYLSEEKAARFAFLREFCYSGMFRYNKKGEFNVPFGGATYLTKTLDKKIQQWMDPGLGSHLNKTTFSNQDFQAFLDQHPPTAKDFVFLDPPYDESYHSYVKNPFDETAQRRLAAYLSKLSARFLLIIKDTPLIQSLYANQSYTILKYSKKYKINFKNRNNQDVEHLAIKNY